MRFDSSSRFYQTNQFMYQENEPISAKDVLIAIIGIAAAFSPIIISFLIDKLS